MTTKHELFGTLIIISLLFVGCFGESNEEKQKIKEEEKVEEGITGALKQLEKALDDVQDGEKKPPVDKEKLKALFPDNIKDMKRVSREVQSGNMVGVSGVHANAKYRGEDGRLELSVVDGGGLGSTLLDIAGKNLNLEIDKETEHGYERTTEIDGHRALEKYNAQTKRGEITIFAFKQFVVSVKGKGLDMKEIKKVLSNLLDGLDDLT